MARPAFSENQARTIRDELVQGAVCLFKENGPENLTLRNLATRLNMSHTKLYRYFASKDALLDAVRIHSLDILEQILLADDPVDSDPITRLHAATLSLHMFATQYQKEYLFLFMDGVHNGASEAFVEKRHKIFNHIVQIAQMAHERGLTKLDGRTLANLSWATLHGLFLLNFSDQLIEGRSFDDLLASAADVLFGTKATSTKSAS